MKNLLLLFVVVLFMTSCQKEKIQNVDNYRFERVTFSPKNEGQLKSIINKFISTIDQGQISTRDVYPNTEVNEAVWTLEATGNFLKNPDLNNGTTTEMQAYTFSVNNVVENGELKMVGSDMTTKFNQLLSDINTDENADDKTAVGVDISIVSTDSDNSNLEARVVYNRVLDPIPWSVATFLITQGNQYDLPYSAGGCYFTDNLVVYNNNENWLNGQYCSNATPTDCFYVGVGTATTIPIYDSSFLPADIATSLAIANEILDDLVNNLPPPPPNGTPGTGSYQVIRSVVKLHHQHPWNSSNLIWPQYPGVNVLSHYVNIVIAAENGYQCW